MTKPSRFSQKAMLCHDELSRISRSESQWESQLRPPSSPRGTNEAGKVSKFATLRGRLDDGVKYTLLGAFSPTFFSMRTGHTACQTPRLVF